MSQAPAAPLITAAELADLLAAGAPLVLLDVRWSLAGTDRAAFAAGHIAGAVFVDLDTELTAPPGMGGRHPLPDPAVLERLFARAGIDPGTPVVVCGQADTSVAGRAWWLLRWAGHADVRVLDGGIDGWRAAGYPVEIGAPRPAGKAAPGRPANRAPRIRPGAMPTVDADGAAALGAGADTVLLDARAPERYRGEVEPVDPVPGHIPGATNLPLAQLHQPDGRLRNPAELREIFTRAGIGPATVAAASCGSGVNACSLVLAGEIIGIPIALYPGSYSGWCALHRPVHQA